MKPVTLEQAQQLAQRGDVAGAMEACNALLRQQPRHADALTLLGGLAAQQGLLAEAGQAWEAALRLRPEQPQLLLNMGTLCLNTHQPQAAIAHYDRLLALYPQWDEAWNAKGNALVRVAKPAEAIACFDQAVALNPQRTDALYSRATAWVRLGEFARAVQSYEQAVAVRPGFVHAWYGLGIALGQLGAWPEAIAAFDRVAAIDPRFGHVLGLRLHSRMKICDWRDHEQELTQLAASVAVEAGVCAPFEALTLWDDPALLGQCAKAYAAGRFASNQPRSRLLPGRGERIRIGYFSADFHAHATSYLVAGLLEQHDKVRFHVTAYTLRPIQDAVTQRLQAAVDAFVDLSGLSDAQALELVRGQGLDIAVDLKGYTELSRPGLFAAGVAAVQVNYLGFPGTMGADFMDYIVVDPGLIPPDERAHYTEQPVYLPHSYQATDNRRTVAETKPTRMAEGLPTHGMVYCCFNNNFKITPTVFASWMRILQSVPGSVLWLLADNVFARANLQRSAAEAGLDPERLVFAPRIAVEEHLARLRLADLFLDTVPYNAHTSASDALWVGLPVLTCMRRSFPARVAASLLQAIDLPELVTHSLDAYEALAIALGQDPPRLVQLRARLEAKRDSAPLFDTVMFTRHLEAAYRAMYQRAQDGLPPECITVPDLTRSGDAG